MATNTPIDPKFSEDLRTLEKYWSKEMVTAHDLFAIAAPTPAPGYSTTSKSGQEWLQMQDKRARAIQSHLMMMKGLAKAISGEFLETNVADQAQDQEETAKLIEEAMKRVGNQAKGATTK